MGISNPMLIWLRNLHESGSFRGLRSIIEFGPQDVVVHPRILKDFVESVTKEPFEPSIYYDGPQIKATAMRPLYETLGLSHYKSIDLVDPRSDYLIDLNYARSLPGRWDVITDFGTSEHLFNIANAAELIHNHLSVGGLRLHVSPTRGDYDHGFYNIQASWFHEMARANNYEIVSLLLIRDFGGQHTEMDADAEAERPYRCTFFDIQSEHDQEGDEIFAETSFRRFQDKKKNPETDSRIYDYIFAAFRKTKDGKFNIPIQHESIGRPQWKYPSKTRIHRSNIYLRIREAIVQWTRNGHDR